MKTIPFRAELFPRYTCFSPYVPVWLLTAKIPGCIHRFFDTSPLSPSGRYLAVTRFPQEQRPPVAGEEAEVLVLDLWNHEICYRARTAAWGTQTGAHVQWGSTDRELFYNVMDVDEWCPYGVCVDILTGKTRCLGMPVYMVCADGSRVAAPCLRRIELSQPGYGVTVPLPFLPVNVGAVDDDGLWIGDAWSGDIERLISFRQIVDALGDDWQNTEYYRDGGFYGFHVKWNPQGDRLMFVVRYRRHGGGVHTRMACDVMTMRPDGREIALALGSQQRLLGGHHPNWHPDGVHITQNLVLKPGEPMRLVQFRHDGSDLRVLSSHRGSGHPSVHPSGRYLVTDCYETESLAYPEGSVPVRWIDLDSDAMVELCRVPVRPPEAGPLRALRIDPHPVFDRSGRFLLFNACLDGHRHVLLADLSSLLA
ncbi:MAG: hypothetical protein D6820_13495 [Lentisphaerae bacterium]|nr:MAG: hypothetical protein D6820_13495 [Lentisphaerota bacterium]